MHDDGRASGPGGAEAPPDTSVAGVGGPRLVLHVFGSTDVGLVREHNEDAFVVADLTECSRGLAEPRLVVGERGTLLGVCDGMGGAAAGEVASRLAVESVYEEMQAGGAPRDHDELAAQLVDAIESAGQRIWREGRRNHRRRGMGTTATIAAILDGRVLVGQVGDSRAYVLRGERLVQVTRDQTLTAQLLEAGQLTAEEAETFEHNNIILQALGATSAVDVDLTYVDLRRGDTLMLCSDGLSGLVRDEEIFEVLRTVDDPFEACRVLTRLANEAGGHDNITIIVARVEGEVEPPTREDVEGLQYRRYELPSRSVGRPPSSAPRSRLLEPATPRPRLVEPAAREQEARPDADAEPGILSDAERRGGDRGNEGSSEGDEVPPADAQPAGPPERATEDAPLWLLLLMLASAIACVVLSAWYVYRR